jgi:hypothetical protein
MRIHYLVYKASGTDVSPYPLVLHNYYDLEKLYVGLNPQLRLLAPISSATS